MKVILLTIFLAILTTVNSCHPGWFECRNGKCIPGNFVCDYVNDCDDLSDELDFETGKCPACGSGMWVCSLNVNGCLPPTKICDGVNDCLFSTEDEVDPETGEGCPGCPTGAGKCSSGQCIYEQWFCDGVIDCLDGSDEQDDFCARRNHTSPTSTRL